jgi:hypothetical protein
VTFAPLRWKKLGLIFDPQRERRSWFASHAANPCAEPLGGDVVRIYFTGRDGEGRSHVGFFEVDMANPMTTLRVSDRPLVSPGVRGSFDDSGVSLGNVVRVGHLRYLYYLGWNLGVTVPWRNSIGLAVSSDGDSYEKVSPAPILDRNAVDPFTLSYPWVLREGDDWHMWYGSTLGWGAGEKEMLHALKYAHSRDGISWTRDGRLEVELRQGESGLSRPCVVRDDDLLRMWYSYRNGGYRIGYAERRTGGPWERRDEEAGIAPSRTGWDSQMVAYPCVFDHGFRRYLLYNGDGFGRTGIGLAVLDRPEPADGAGT